MEQKTFDFINTIEESGPTLELSIAKAKDQQSKILAFYVRNWPMNFTPTEILRAVFRDGHTDKITPLTSVRRAISNLTKAGKLVKTDFKRPGHYGKMNFAWTYNNESNK